MGFPGSVATILWSDRSDASFFEAGNVFLQFFCSIENREVAMFLLSLSATQTFNSILRWLFRHFAFHRETAKTGKFPIWEISFAERLSFVRQT